MLSRSKTRSTPDDRSERFSAELPEESVSFETFFRSEWAQVVTLAATLSGSRAAAEDIAQEAFAAAFRRWEATDRLEHPAVWVRRVTANMSVSWIRRRVREAAAIARLARSNVDVELLDDPIADEYWNAVRSLPKRQAQCMALRYLEDRPTEEIAGILAIAESTVRVHLHHARAALAERLNERSEEL